MHAVARCTRRRFTARPANAPCGFAVDARASAGVAAEARRGELEQGDALREAMRVLVEERRPELLVPLALFAQMERTYMMERAAHARAVAAAKGRRVGRPVLVDRDKLDYAAHLRDQGETIAEIVKKTGIPRTSLYRHLPPRPAPAVTADGSPAVGRDGER